MNKKAYCRGFVKDALELTNGNRLPKNVIQRIEKETGSTNDYARKLASEIRREWQAEKDHPGLAKECEAQGIAVSDVSHYWHKGKSFSIFSKAPKKTYEDVRDEVIADMQAHAPKYPKIKRKKVKDGHLLVIDPADIHIGKLATAFETGDDYNADIAVKRVMEGVHGIINHSSSWNIDKVLLVIGNDILHVDTPKNTTTSGTTQDTSMMWYDAFLEAKGLYVEVIETLLSLADVHVVYNPSNHDYQSGFFLADSIASWFSRSKNITFDISIAHRKYFQYGKNIIGTTHGDGAKTSDLPLLMAQETAGKGWDCPHRYVYTHHLHHKVAKDYGSVCVEALRSPSGTDSWHHRNGYQHAPKAVEGFIHSKEHGQIVRITHLF